MNTLDNLRHVLTSFDSYEEVHADFMEKAKLDPEYAVEWRGYEVVRHLYIHREVLQWLAIIDYYEPEGLHTLATRLTEIHDKTVKQATNSSFWTKNSTNPIANYLATAKAEAMMYVNNLIGYQLDRLWNELSASDNG